MPLNRLDNFIKNIEGRILYVNPNDIDATDAITNQGNSLTQPFKTIQRALLEASRFSYIVGNTNDITEKTTILLFPGEHIIDNRPGYAIKNISGTAYGVSPGGSQSLAISTFSLTLSSVFDLTQSGNILYKFNSINGGVIVPRGTSIVGLDLRKTKIRPLYVPNPTDDVVPNSAFFRITGACYFWQFGLFDANQDGLVYTNHRDFSSNNQSTPTFSHHKLTCFEYADGVNIPIGYSITDLDMYYAKVSNAFDAASGRDIPEKYPNSPLGFAKKNPEWEIVGAFATDPINISAIISGDGITVSNQITVTTFHPHNLQASTPIKINGVSTADYNISTKVQTIIGPNQFTYLLPYVRNNLPASPSLSNATATIETDTVNGASPYIFNISLRSVWGLNGMYADGSKASGFRSMVVAQFTGVSLQKDDRAFVVYNQSSRNYQGINYTSVSGSLLSSGSSSTDSLSCYHLNPNAIHRNGWGSTHIKGSNDAFIQVVSVFAIGYSKHFEGINGSDFSITNSNSNFGESSITSTGFKNRAFSKDDTAYVTSIIGPRAITNNSNNSITISKVTWVQIDVGLTVSAAISGHLYLYGFNSIDVPPPNIIQGYRIGANYNEQLYVQSKINLNTTNAAFVYMTNNMVSGGNPVATGTNISEKNYRVTSGPNTNNIFNIGTHNLQTGESIRIQSDIADLPENIEESTVYYAITSDLNASRTDGISLSSSEIQIASSLTNAGIPIAITVYGGSSLIVTSRVSDKNPNDIGSPIQWDTNNNNWFIHVDSGNSIYNECVTYGTSGLGLYTNAAYVKRALDSRGIDEKLYKLRVVIPKETVYARNPVESYVIQESSSKDRNPKFISICSASSSTVTVETELPHHLKIGNVINVLDVKDTSNSTGADNIGYNGTFSVVSIIDDKRFTYSTEDIFRLIHTPGTFTSNINDRTGTLPRFKRNDLKSNYYIYRSDVINNYEYNVQDGIYHLYVLNANNSVSVEFTDAKYSQNIINLYPQMDRDNLNEDPNSASSFALRFPLGQVATNDLQKSITKETIDKFVKDFGIGLGSEITSVSAPSGGFVTVTFDRPHGLSGIVTYSSLSGGSGHTNGTYYDVKLYNNAGLSVWNGATAKVIVSGNAVTGAEIISKGSAYTSGQTLYFDTSKIGGSANATISITSSGLTTAIGNVVQFAGIGTAPTFYSRINSIPSKTQISVASTSGDPSILPSQYGFITGPSIPITSTSYNSTTGITTFTVPYYHGLLSGNRFKVIDSSNNNLGNYLVINQIDVTKFTAYTGNSLSSPAYILRHGLSANAVSSDIDGENVNVRDISFFDNDTLTITSFTDDTHIRVSTTYTTGGTSIPSRFPLGTYIQVDNEIMKVVSSSLGGTYSDEITVNRGALGTIKQTHNSGSLVKKIVPLPIELRRPSTLRASSQTFEYLGYGPGNYSTSLPDLQINNLNDTQTYLSQSQEKSCGAVVYSGMNNDGDFYIGNKKLSSKTGKEVVFDAPIPTVRGESANSLSVIFDQVTIKRNLIVEGGNSNNILSQFNGPLLINGQLTANSSADFAGIVNISNTTNSTSKTTGALVVAGGVGIGKSLNVGETLNITGNTTVGGTLDITGNTTVGGTLDITGTSILSGQVTINTGIIPDTDTGAYLGQVGNAFSEAHINGIQIGYSAATTIDTRSGNLVLSAASGTLAINNDTTITGNLDMTSGTGILSANYLQVPNITPIGSVVMWCGTVNNFPTGWAVCNGTELPIATYTALYNVLTNSGSSFPFGANTDGSGNPGDSHFRMPNMVDRFIVGSGNAYSVGETGGADSVILNTTQIPSHNHTLTDPGHAHTYVGAFWPSPSGPEQNQAGSPEDKTDFNYGRTTDSATTGITINNVGGGLAHENRPPYFALIYLMRII